jgi:hypothetical protein
VKAKIMNMSADRLSRTLRAARRGVLSVGLAVALVLIVAAVAHAVSINWGAAANPIYDESGLGGTPLADGSVVQLIWDADQDGADPPGADGLPQEGDQLLDTSLIGIGAFPNIGRFSDNWNTNVVGPGNRIYVRAWNANSLPLATHYGDSPLATITSSVAFTFDCTASGSFATVIPLAATCIEGDVDCNCEVGVSDVVQVASSWLATFGDPNYVLARDVNQDGVIDILDLMFVSARFGATCA